MKNFTLSLTFIFSLSFCFSQCVPDSIYADSTFGVWPTPQTNFPPGEDNYMNHHQRMMGRNHMDDEE